MYVSISKYTNEEILDFIFGITAEELRSMDEEQLREWLGQKCDKLRGEIPPPKGDGNK